MKIAIKYICKKHAKENSIDQIRMLEDHVRYNGINENFGLITLFFRVHLFKTRKHSTMLNEMYLSFKLLQITLH